MNRVGLLIIYFLSSFNVSAADKLKNTKNSKGASAIRAVSINNRTWIPEIFVIDTERLKAKYDGNNPKFFYETLKRNFKKIEKGEFETSEEYSQRIDNTESLLAPISTSELYAFRVFENLETKYDPDTQSYKLKESTACRDALEPDKSEWLTCDVGFVKSESSSYIGGNAYGATAEIDRLRALEFSLAISSKNDVFKSMLSKDAYFDKYAYEDNISVAIDKAKKLKEKTIAMIFVGQIKEAKIIKGRGYHSQATLDWTYEHTIDEEAVPFELKKVVYYVYETGEILGQKLF